MPAEITHTNLQPTIDLTMGVHGRDLGHVADDVRRRGRSVRQVPKGRGGWTPLRPDARPDKKLLKGSKITLSGEYSRMQDTFRNLGIGLILASAADLLPDGRPVQVVADAAGDPVGGAGRPGRRGRRCCS